MKFLILISLCFFGYPSFIFSCETDQTDCPEETVCEREGLFVCAGVDGQATVEFPGNLKVSSFYPVLTSEKIEFLNEFQTSTLSAFERNLFNQTVDDLQNLESLNEKRLAALKLRIKGAHRLKTINQSKVFTPL